jgi:hypothetical protein
MYHTKTFYPFKQSGKQKMFQRVPSQANETNKQEGEWACSPMVGWSSETLPTRVQILVLAPFYGFFS